MQAPCQLRPIAPAFSIRDIAIVDHLPTGENGGQTEILDIGLALPQPAFRRFYKGVRLD
jgi:hypothetical protein